MTLKPWKQTSRRWKLSVDSLRHNRVASSLLKVLESVEEHSEIFFCRLNLDYVLVTIFNLWLEQKAFHCLQFDMNEEQNCKVQTSLCASCHLNEAANRTGKSSQRSLHVLCVRFHFSPCDISRVWKAAAIEIHLCAQSCNSSQFLTLTRPLKNGNIVQMTKSLQILKAIHSISTSISFHLLQARYAIRSEKLWLGDDDYNIRFRSNKSYENTICKLLSLSSFNRRRTADR